MHILAVSADGPVVAFLPTVLEPAGHRLTIVPDIIQAAAAVRAARPDLILWDLTTPELKERDYLELKRREAHVAGTPVIFLADPGGTTLPADCVWLPKPLAADTLRAAVGPATPAGAEILLIEDEVLLRNLLTFALKRAGYSLRVAEDGSQGVELFEQHGGTIALVISNVKLPDMDGPQVIARLRQRRPHLLFCFITGDAGAYTMEKLRAQGALCVLEKPFQIDELFRIVASVIPSP